jgi:hypothetical protein
VPPYWQKSHHWEKNSSQFAQFKTKSWYLELLFSLYVFFQSTRGLILKSVWAIFWSFSPKLLCHTQLIGNLTPEVGSSGLKIVKPWKLRVSGWEFQSMPILLYPCTLGPSKNSIGSEYHSCDLIMYLQLTWQWRQLFQLWQKYLGSMLW